MNRMRRRLTEIAKYALMCVLIGWSSSSCITYKITANTIVLEDGYCQREFSVAGPDGKEAKQPLRDAFVLPERGGWDIAVIEEKQLHLSGVFGPGQPIPVHFKLKPREGQVGSEHRLRIHIADYAIAALYVYDETITNHVPLQTWEEKGGELVRLHWELARQAMQEDLGTDYELGALFEHIDTVWRPAAAQMGRTYYHDKLLKKSDRLVMQDMIGIISKAGFPLREEHLKNEASRLELLQFGRERLKELIRPKGNPDGKISDADVARLLLYFRIGDEEEGKAGGLQEGIERVAVARFGTKEAFEKQKESLSAACFGAYYDVPACQFVFGVNLPGDVVRTNGLICGGGRVEWDLGGDSTFPMGYGMRAEALLLREEVQKRIAGRRVFEEFKDALDYLREAEELGEESRRRASLALKQTSASGNLDPVKELLKSEDKGLVDFANRTLGLLVK